MSETAGATPRQPRARRNTGVAAMALLSAFTGYISYLHGYQIAILVGNPRSVAYVLPLVPDLMIVTSSMTLLEARAAGAGRPPMSMLALVAGIAWTVTQNVAAGLHESTGNAILSAGVPFAFVMTFEALLWQFQSREPATPKQPRPPCTHRLPPTATVDEQILATWLHGDSCGGKAPSFRQLASEYKVGRNRVASVVRSAQNGSAPDGA